MWTSSPGPTTQVDLLVEEDRELRRLHPALGDVVGVVEPDAQELARPDRGQQAHVLERVSLSPVAGRRTSSPSTTPCCGLALRFEPAALHDASGISTGAWSGA